MQARIPLQPVRPPVRHATRDSIRWQALQHVRRVRLAQQVILAMRNLRQFVCCAPKVTILLKVLRYAVLVPVVRHLK